MAVVDEVLKELEKNSENYISGQAMADRLSVSRAAIWKSIKTLQEQGYIIEAVTNKGYKLSSAPDLLSETIIRNNLVKELKKAPIHLFESIDSTNTEARRMILEKTPENWTLIFSEEQTGGRGRQGKSFLSPNKKGIYMTIILLDDVDNPTDNFDIITVKAAVAVSRAVEKFTNENPKIKWVNDLYIGDKKICGILTEAEWDYESNVIKGIIIGIGINITTTEEDFTPELKKIAGSLNPRENNRNKISAEVVNELYNIIENEKESHILKEYKEKSNVLGKEIVFIRNGTEKNALAIDINDMGNLVVKSQNEVIVLSSGEISIRGDWS